MNASAHKTSRFRTVVFDLDGTLADTAPDLTAALNHALAALGRPPVPAENVRHMVGHGVRALLRKGLGATGECTEEMIDRGFPIFLDYYEAHIADHSRPFDGVDVAAEPSQVGTSLVSGSSATKVHWSPTRQKTGKLP